MTMVVNRSPAIVLILAMAASPVLAGTYKWVDAKGAVTYSDSPPPSMAVKSSVVEERVSVIPPDPSIGPAVAAMQARAARRAQDEEADYLQRQRYMLEAQANYAATTCPYGSNCGVGYASAYYPYGYGGWGYRTGGARRGPPYAMHHRASFRPGVGAAPGRGPAPAGRGSFR